MGPRRPVQKKEEEDMCELLEKGFFRADAVSNYISTSVTTAPPLVHLALPPRGDKHEIEVLFTCACILWVKSSIRANHCLL